MLLITFLGLFAKLAMVSDACDVGTQDVKSFIFFKVGITVLTWLMKKVALKTAAGFYVFV